MKNFRHILAIALLVTATACAPAHQANVDSDPLEPLNRQIFAFNEVVDEVILRPLALGYRAITTPGIRTSVRNVFTNLTEPVTVVSSLLQGDVTHAVTSAWRFALNTTLGLGGISDFAGRHGLEHRNEDYSQALAVWGVPSGPYLVLPVIGPSNIRDAVGSFADTLANPLYIYGDLEDEAMLAIAVGDGITRREQVDELIQSTYETSLDPYTTFRSLYLQRRNAMILNSHNPREATSLAP